MRRRRQIPKRAPYFLGCEGESEVGYGRRLEQIASAAGLHVAFRIECLQPGAGDPRELVAKAILKIKYLEAQRIPFRSKAVLIDVNAPDKMEAAEALAAAQEVIVIWQSPDHEAFLLRHLEGCQFLRPPKGRSLVELQKHWPDYVKNMPARRLAERVDLAGLQRARSIERRLAAFLDTLGLPA